MTIPYQPLNDFILVLADKPLDRTKNGILLTEASKSGAKTGRVVAVGPGKLNEKTGKVTPVSVRVGQRVAFGEFAGRSDLPVDPEYPRGALYKILSNSDILAVVEQTEEDYAARIREALAVLGVEEKAMDQVSKLSDGAPAGAVAGVMGVVMHERLIEWLSQSA